MKKEKLNPENGLYDIDPDLTGFSEMWVSNPEILKYLPDGMVKYRGTDEATIKSLNWRHALKDMCGGIVKKSKIKIRPWVVLKIFDKYYNCFKMNSLHKNLGILKRFF